MTQERETVGKIATDLIAGYDGKQGVVDTAVEANKDYLDQMQECVVNAYNSGWDKPFYVVVVSKKERALQNVIRRYFVARKTMPAPDYDQSVFHYDPKAEKLTYLWTIPDPDACITLLHGEPDPEFTELRAMVDDFVNDRLYDRFAMQFEAHNEWAAEHAGNATKRQVFHD